jgi:biotin carboxyl carrier protein
MEFRRGALAKREAPDELTAAVRSVPARTWPALLLLASIVAGGIGWGFAGHIPVSTEASGVLTVPDGSFGVQSPVVGQVSRVVVKPGAALPANAVVAEIAGEGGRIRVRTAVPGRVAEVSVDRGESVAPGTVLCIVERVAGAGAGAGEQTVAVVYVPVRSGVLAPPGMRVDVEVDAAPAAVFGKIEGRVVQAAVVPEGRRDVAQFLVDDDLAALLTADGPVRRVVVELARDASTPTGYRWTRGPGPPFRVTTRATVRGTLHQSPQRPIDWVLP